MEFIVNEEAFKDRGLKVVLSGLFGSLNIWIDGVKIKGEQKLFRIKERKMFMLKDNSGREVKAILKKSTFDPVPELILDGKKIILAPPLKWFEYAWVIGPLFVLMVTGGVLPVFFAFLGYFINIQIFRSKLNGFLRYFLTLLSAALAWFACIITAGIIMRMIPS